jgi:hypothetical protein
VTDLGVNGRIIKLISEKSGGLDSSGLRRVLVAGCCEHGNEPSGSIKGGEFLDSLSDC